MEKSVFKVGDKVFDCRYGWGIVNFIVDKSFYPINVKFGRYSYDYTWDGRAFLDLSQVLSFTEYTFKGFSQERPEKLPKKGDIVWASNHKSGWCVCYFLEKVIDGGYKCTAYNPFIPIPIPSYTYWNYITTENPYI
jgi:hypothetical protein